MYKSEQLKQAYLLGQKIANDIRDRKRYPFQGIGKRILNMLFLKKVFTQNVIYHKDDMMKAVYMELKEQGLIA
jgi:hypothetical protein